MTTRASIWCLASTIAGLTACGATPADQLRARAATDFSCPRDKVVLTALDPEPFVSGEAADWSKSVAVAACGKSSTYVREHGDWVKNNDVQNPETPAAEVPPADK